MIIRSGYNLSALGEPWIVTSIVPNTHREGFSTIYISGKITKRQLSIGIKNESLTTESLVREALIESITRHFDYNR